ncbi:hypothetical protein WJX82_009864 [Trebouxia sp. C0006]
MLDSAAQLSIARPSQVPSAPESRTWTTLVPSGFDLAQAVCSYGFFTQAPNSWEMQCHDMAPSSGHGLRRPLLTSADDVFDTVIHQSGEASCAESCLRVKIHKSAHEHEMQQLKAQVHRMLRLSTAEQAQVHTFHNMHAAAREEGFGRLFRSPTVWEDLIKSILLCNCGWSRTLTMNKALCSKAGKGAFPSPTMLIQAGAVKLQSECGLGYRAKTLIQLAEQVLTGEADIDGLEAPGLSSEEVYQRLLPLPGVGPFTAANMLQLLGHYSRIPCDSETVRHLHKVHNLQSCTLANVQHHAQQVYAKYAPYQFLAYWHELWREYESLVGPFAQVDPECYHLLTGHNMRRAAKEGSQKDSEPHSQEICAHEECLMHVSSALQSEGSVLQSEGSVLNRKERQPLTGSTAKGSGLRKRHAVGSGLQESVRRSQRVKMRIPYHDRKDKPI